MVNQRWLCIASFGLAATLLLGSPADAQNLLSNGTFNSGVAGWSASSTTITLIFRNDAGSTLSAGSGPGCLEVRFANWNGGASGPTQQVPVTVGTVYELAGSFFIPRGDNPTTGAWLDLDWIDENGLNVGGLGSLMDLTYDTWTRLSGTAAAPANAKWARITLRVDTPNDPQGTLPSIVLWDDIWLAGAGTATATQELFVPAAAAVHGQAGTYWSTNGWLSNLTNATLSVAGAFLHQGQDNSAAVSSPTTLGTIGPMGFLRLADVVTMLGKSEVAGGIYLLVSAQAGGLPAELVSVTTHTFTPNPSGGGVYGQGIPAVAAGVRGSATVPGVFQGAELRTNVGALNTSGGAISLEVTVLNAAGNEEVSVTWTLQPYEQRQVSLPSLGLSSLDGGTVLFELRGGGSFRGYTSTVDQQSGDAVYNEAR